VTAAQAEAEFTVTELNEELVIKRHELSPTRTAL